MTLLVTFVYNNFNFYISKTEYLNSSENYVSSLMESSNYMNAMMGLFMIITILSFSFIGRRVYALENRIATLEKPTNT